ncbi:hypothetical protein [Methylobacterium sp. Leaf85]|uniref:hypothetical protein n=1 Tax=Methylobacterium sp. Leaf85 TaxID=1736241 RepID=UPI0006F56E36|nr:hypothetical protein [Methylobacterium sp. Leaf85]KQO51585.1 hypothetical protein ASF08_21920 [Methylobacterium sp. Leaf85]
MTTRLRLDRAKRLLAVQAQMRGIAERDLADTRRRGVRVEADRAAMLATLAGETMHGLFLDAAARRLRALAGEATELDVTAARQAAAVQARGLAEKRAERQVEGLAKLRDRELEQRDMLEQLDLMVARATSGGPG